MRPGAPATSSARRHSTPATGIIVTNTHDPAQGILTTRLLSADGTSPISADRTEDGVQEVTNFLGESGAYTVEVCGQTASTINLYDLDVQVIEQSPGVDVVARDVTVPERSSFSIGARLDVDFVVYNLGQVASGPFTAEVRISTDAIIDNNDPLLSSVALMDVPAATRRDLTASVVLPSSLNDGDYFIGVDLDPQGALTDTAPMNNTALSRQITVATQCFDALEPNDSFMDAYPINASGQFANLTSCASAGDYYEICADNGKKVEVTARFTHANGDIDIELYDQQFQRIDSSATKADVEQVAVPYVNGDQCYYAYVYLITVPGQMQQETLYELDVAIDDVAPSLLCSSYAEPNDSFSTATSLSAAAQAQQTLDRCPVTDTDFFFFDVSSPGQSVTITASKDPAMQAGTLRIQLYGPNQSPVVTEETAPDQPVAEITNFVASSAGRHWVQVTASGNMRSVGYDLDVTGLDFLDLAAENLSIGPGSYAPGDVLRVGFSLSNKGSTATATPPTYAIAIGTSATPDAANDVPLNAGGYTAPSSVMGGGTLSIFERTTVPAGLTDGSYFLHVTVDDTGDIAPANNVATVPITISTMP